MIVRKLLPHDFLAIELQEEQKYMREFLTGTQLPYVLSQAGPALTFIKDGVVLACIGVQEHNQVRGEAWALLSKDAGKHLGAITTSIRGWLSQCAYKRIEANVATDFRPGHRWAKLLGFEQEGGERKQFFPGDRSAITYVRIKDGGSSTSRGSGDFSDRIDSRG